jgi:D-mannonate dehydratase
MRNSIARIYNFIRGTRHFTVQVDQYNTYVGEGWTKTDAQRSIDCTKQAISMAQEQVASQAAAQVVKQANQ